MSDRIARIVSIVLHPIVTLLVLLAVAAGWSRVVALAVAIGFVPIIGLILSQRKSGRWRNADASVPSERHVLFGASLVCVLLLAVVLWRWSPQPRAARGALAVGAIFAVAWALLPWIKLSLHVAFCAYAAAMLTFIDLRVAAPMFLAVPVLAWARVRMKRHTIREVLAGGAIGLIAGVLSVVAGATPALHPLDGLRYHDRGVRLHRGSRDAASIGCRRTNVPDRAAERHISPGAPLATWRACTCPISRGPAADHAG
ncbi:MAG: hypothetical protein ACXV5L_10005 [Thermoanaerobaculia bacterium]